jgi:hypothetical protein
MLYEVVLKYQNIKKTPHVIEDEIDGDDFTWSV